MPTVRPSTGLAITDPLVLYRSLLATKRIDPDTAQYRLALHLQKLYNRLVDYEPTIEYGQRIRQLTQTVEKTTPSKQLHEARKRLDNGRSTSMLAAYRAHKEKEETMALTRKLTDHESATQIQSPQGLLLYGEVGTGKSMLVDLFAECLPSRKKRRWHFNTFMLEIFSRLEQVRKSHSTKIYEEAENLRSYLSQKTDFYLTYHLPGRVSVARPICFEDIVKSTYLILPPRRRTDSYE